MINNYYNIPKSVDEADDRPFRPKTRGGTWRAIIPASRVKRQLGGYLEVLKKQTNCLQLKEIAN
jgi:hypothetical protein